MNIKETLDWYWTEARRTASDAGLGEKGMLAHSILGIASEMEELLKSQTTRNTYEELGDLMWYCACGMSKQHFVSFFSRSDSFGDSSRISELRERFPQIVDECKSLIFYGKSKHTGLHISMLFDVASEIGFALGERGDLFELRLITVMRLNIKKLQKRYPGAGFSADDAVARADKDGKE